MKKTLIYITLFIITTSCSSHLVPFSTNVQSQVGLNEDDLKKVQFYNSSRIVLYRELGKNITKVESGNIEYVNGGYYEQVIINPRTPGVLVKSDEGKKLSISFEEGPGRTIMFGLDPQRSGMFSIYGRDWQNQVATIDYDGKEFKLAPESANTVILVNFKKLNDSKIHSRNASGRLINR